MPDDSRPRRTPSCPQCGRPRDRQYRPFCSPRCRDLDLGKWLNGAYAIPAVEAEDDSFEADRPIAQDDDGRL